MSVIKEYIGRVIEIMNEEFVDGSIEPEDVKL